MALPLSPWATVRRKDWQELLGELNQRIDPLDRALQQQAKQRPEVRLLTTHPGVGPVVATAFVLTIGEPGRFQTSKQVAAYLGLVPLENSSGIRTAAGRSYHQARQQSIAGTVDRSSSGCLPV